MEWTTVLCLASASLYALVAMSLGVYMAASHDHVLAPAQPT